MMQFDPGAFDDWLGNIGQQMEWRRSYVCPCVNPASGHPDPRHALCNGKGRIWNDSVRTVVGVASQKVQLQWAQMGLWEAGDTVLSIPQSSPMWGCGPFDRIVDVNSQDAFTMVLQRGAPTERLLFRPASLGRCFWLHPTTRLPVDGGIPVVAADGTLSWAGVDEPPPGTSYSLTGTKFSEYFIFQELTSNRNQHQGMRLPKRVVARRWDLFGR